MASRPKHVRGTLIAVFFAVVVLPFVLWLGALFGPAIWVSAAVTTGAVGALVWRRRRVETARERAYEGSSFGSVVIRMRAREAAYALVIEKRRFELLGAR
jgi:hypothetical protein